MAGLIFVVVLTLIAAFLAAIAQYLFKQSLPKFNFNLNGVVTLIRNRMVILGLVVYVISLGIYLVALRFGDLSFVYPTFASVFLFVFILSKFKLHEEISVGRALGMAFVLIGIILVVVTY
jgi:uncharacterized membrane protein